MQELRCTLPPCTERTPGPGLSSLPRGSIPAFIIGASRSVLRHARSAGRLAFRCGFRRLGAAQRVGQTIDVVRRHVEMRCDADRFAALADMDIARAKPFDQRLRVAGGETQNVAAAEIGREYFIIERCDRFGDMIGDDPQPGLYFGYSPRFDLSQRSDRAGQHRRDAGLANIEAACARAIIGTVVGKPGEVAGIGSRQPAFLERAFVVPARIDVEYGLRKSQRRA